MYWTKAAMAVFVTAGLCGCAAVEVETFGYAPVGDKIMTPWAAEVGPGSVLPEYPRPQMERKDWKNLNGLWDYAITSHDAPPPQEWDGKILVPFAIESALSDVGKSVLPEQRLWYRCVFSRPKGWNTKRMLLHFGAVDWEAVVWVNGKKIGSHLGGYDPFTLDITEALTGDGEQELIVSVWDPTDRGTQPRGKQVLRPNGIWYTAVTGIWQTVWMEPVPDTYITSLRIIPDIDSDQVLVQVNTNSKEEIQAEVEIGTGILTNALGRGAADEPIRVSVPNAQLWSPDRPFLYDMRVTLKNQGKKGDVVHSYFGMRKIALGQDKDGINRLFLNNEPLFQYGPLDQGWWPDGLYTAPTDEALRYDIEVIKRLGCNMLRKHVKVEPARLYYWCDKLGLLVWQDMPSGDRYIGGNDPDIQRSKESADQFELEWRRIIEAFYNHPSIIMWVPFNEGWGQYDTPRIVGLTKQWDPTRLVNNASGWTDRKVGDVIDIHRYPGPGVPALEPTRAGVLGEFGGLGLPIKGHTWQDERNWGYRSYNSQEELTDAYLNLLARLRNLIGQGLSAAVYTQTTDVEVEVNGWMTYDRKIIKVDVETSAAAARKLYLPPPVVKTILGHAGTNQPGEWKYTFTAPAEGWEKPDFDDSGWKVGKAGFGTDITPGAIVGTPWNGPNIWIRRTFDLATLPSQLQLSIHHDEDAQVFLNGVPAAQLRDYTTGYVMAPISDQAVKALKPGKNTMAIHCKQSSGGQYIDAGLLEVIESKE
ncbi:MAG: hypothetical protein JW828_04205 [Sedimentisphaerales bacterium]|nr:hypothetical protein [Sedimentisphaerales bacterium]